MKKLFYILSIILVYLIISAKSCNQAEQHNAALEQRKIKFTRDSIIDALCKNKLSQPSINAFGESAKMKFYDFLDYIKILSDSCTAPTFKNQTSKMISDLFLSSNTQIRINDLKENRNQTTDLKELMNSESIFKNYINGIQLDSIWILDELRPINDTIYQGMLKLRYTTNLKETKTGSIEFWAAKRDKSFGKDTLKVWIVCLGNSEI